MAAFWEDLKKTVQQGLSVAAEKTEEYTKIGKVKMDILGIKKDLDKTYREMGEKVSELIDSKKSEEIGSNTQVKKLKTQINKLQKNLKAKEVEIEEIKKQHPDVEDVEVEEVVEKEPVVKEEPKKTTRARRTKKTE